MEELIHNLLGKKKRIVIGGASVFLGMVVLAFGLGSGPDAITYAKAESAFSKWESSPENEQLYFSMRRAMQNVPDLNRKYEPAIAQKLLGADRIEEGLLLAQRSIARVREEAPFHSAYGETSLLIQQGNFQRALERAVSLKELMKDEGGILYAYNLLRIACLQQELKNPAGEKAGWEELEAYLKSHREVSDLFAESLQGESGILNEYIAERKKSL